MSNAMANEVNIDLAVHATKEAIRTAQRVTAIAPDADTCLGMTMALLCAQFMPQIESNANAMTFYQIELAIMREKFDQHFGPGLRVAAQGNN